MSNQHEIYQPEEFKEREIDILRLIAEGLTNREISEELFLSVNTVRWYNKQIYEKLDVHSRTSAIVKARELGLLALENGHSPAQSVERHQPAINIPIQATPFVGRQAELKSIMDQFETHNVRLLTLVGTGGIGKTRLAIEAATQLAETYADGVYFVPLTTLTCHEDMMTAIANALGLDCPEGAGLEERLLNFFAERNLLLVLDNFEHLLEHAQFVSAVLQNAPELSILVTSRERLNLHEETQLSIGGMDMPTSATQDPLGTSAVQLFLQSIHRVRPAYQASPSDMEAIVAICQRVDGMPLAIELAAAWVELLSPTEILLEIDRSLDFLASNMRNMPERHRSIRAIFDASWQMLDAATQTTYAQLSVFRGGFTREAVATIAQADLHTLITLANKSFITRNPITGIYEVHELLRQYGEEKLEQSGTADVTRHAHATHYTHCLKQYDTVLQDDSDDERLNRIELEFENIRAAWHWASVGRHMGMIEDALSSLYSFCIRRGRLFEALTLFDKALNLVQPQARRNDGLVILQLQVCRGKIRGMIGDFHGAVEDLQAVQEKAHTMGDAEWERDILVQLGQLYRKADRRDEAIRSLNRVLDTARRDNDERTVANVLYHLGTVAWDEGDRIAALNYHMEAADICRALEITDIIGVQAHHGLGEAYFSAGEPDKAIENFQISLDMARHIGDRAYEAENIQMMGWVMAGTLGLADYQEGIRLMNASLAITDDANMEWHTMCSLMGLGLMEGSLGRYQDGFTHLERGIQIAEQLHIARMVTVGIDSQAEILMDLERYDEAASTYEAGLQVAYQAETGFWIPRLQAGLAIVRMRLGQLDVLDDLLLARQVANENGLGFHLARTLEGLIEYHWRTGQHEQAITFVDELATHAQSHRMPEMAAQALRWRGIVCFAQASLPEAITYLEQALAQAQPIGRLRLILDCHLALSEVYGAMGDDQQATHHQHEAQAIMAQFGSFLTPK